RGQRQQLRPIDQQLLGRYRVLTTEVVSEAIRDRLEDGEGFRIGLRRRGIRASRREGHRHGVAAILRRLLDARATGQHDQVGQRDFLAARLSFVELVLDALQRLEDLCQLGGLVDLPVLLRREANARAVRSSSLVGATECGRRRPGRRYQLRDGQPRRQDLALEGGNILFIDQLVIGRRDRVLPDELFGRNLWTEVA